MKILSLFIFFIACNSLLIQPSIVNSKPSNISVLTSATSGLGLETSNGIYFADKLTENLMSDSTTIFDRSLVNAFEISHKIEGRYAISPKEFATMHNYFKSDYYILSHCRLISKEKDDYELEIEVRVIDSAQKILRIESIIVEEKNINSALKNAAKTLARYL
jgi:hypothetical protein